MPPMSPCYTTSCLPFCVSIPIMHTPNANLIYKPHYASNCAPLLCTPIVHLIMNLRYASPLFIPTITLPPHPTPSLDPILINIQVNMFLALCSWV